MTKKIAIVIGHNERAQGAVRVTDGVSEWIWNQRLADLILGAGTSDTAFGIFLRTQGGGYSREIDRIYGEVDNWGADCSIELHFNGATNASVEGCLTLSSGSSGSLKLARLVQHGMCGVMDNRNRGVEIRTKTMRGGRSLWAGKSPAIMTEPFFGSNHEMCRRADARIDQLADAIAQAAIEFVSG